MPDSTSILDLPDPFDDPRFHGLISDDQATVHALFDEWVQAARQYAAGAGTSAYEMLAAAETANVEVTDTLIQMVAATVLATLIDEEGGGRANITISPFQMDEMMRRYELTATRDGMITAVSIKARPGMFPGLEVSGHTVPADIPMPESMYLTDDPADSGPAAPQAAEHTYDRPLWAARLNGRLYPASDRAQAERVVERKEDEGYVAQVENRFCYHDGCPSDRCNMAQSASDDGEVTSGS